MGNKIPSMAYHEILTRTSALHGVFGSIPRNPCPLCSRFWGLHPRTIMPHCSYMSNMNLQELAKNKISTWISKNTNLYKNFQDLITKNSFYFHSRNFKATSNKQGINSCSNKKMRVGSYLFEGSTKQPRSTL